MLQHSVKCHNLAGNHTEALTLYLIMWQIVKQRGRTGYTCWMATGETGIKKYKYARAPAKLVGRADSTRRATLVNGHCVLRHTQLMCSVLSITNVFKLVKQFNSWLGVQRRQ